MIAGLVLQFLDEATPSPVDARFKIAPHGVNRMVGFKLRGCDAANHTVLYRRFGQFADQDIGNAL